MIEQKVSLPNISSTEMTEERANDSPIVNSFSPVTKVESRDLPTTKLSRYFARRLVTITISAILGLGIGEALNHYVDSISPAYAQGATWIIPNSKEACMSCHDDKSYGQGLTITHPDGRQETLPNGADPAKRGWIMTHLSPEEARKFYLGANIPYPGENYNQGLFPHNPLDYRWGRNPIEYQKAAGRGPLFIIQGNRLLLPELPSYSPSWENLSKEQKIQFIQDALNKDKISEVPYDDIHDCSWAAIQMLVNHSNLPFKYYENDPNLKMERADPKLRFPIYTVSLKSPTEGYHIVNASPLTERPRVFEDFVYFDARWDRILTRELIKDKGVKEVVITRPVVICGSHGWSTFGANWFSQSEGEEWKFSF